MTRLVFIDTETTSLRPDRRAWEIGLIVRSGSFPEATDKEFRFFIERDFLDLGNADPAALRIGRFYERHPEFGGVAAAAANKTGVIEHSHGFKMVGNEVWTEVRALLRIEELTRGAHLVGAVPNFDAEVLAARMREYGICPSWHYHLIDIEALMVGYIAGRHRANLASPEVPLPWKSDDLAQRCGVQPLADKDRHTALGDARWARDIYDAVMGGAR